VVFVRKVRTGSGAVAVQLVQKLRGRREILAHVGSAHTDVELGVLLEKARQWPSGTRGISDSKYPCALSRSPMWPPALPRRCSPCRRSSKAYRWARSHCGDQFAAALRGDRRGL
jgi:hypothetical protein